MPVAKSVDSEMLLVLSAAEIFSNINCELLNYKILHRNIVMPKQSGILFVG